MTAPRPFSLAPGVHAARVDGDLVFLDIARDAYVCLPDGGRGAAISADGGLLCLDDPTTASDLLAAGLVLETLAPPGPARWRSTPPRLSAVRDAYPTPRLDHLPLALRAVTDLTLRYRGKPFAAILGAAASRRGEAPRLTPILLDTVDAFHTVAPYLPAPAKCLTRSFMLLRLLRRRGLDALWVFGVRTWPFHAHCWLQCEDMALDDHPDRLASYTPILVV